MIITIADKKYDAKRRLNVAEVMQVRQKAANLIGINGRIASASPEELIKIQGEIMMENEAQDQLVIDILSKVLGRTPEQVTEMEYLDAVMLFSELFDESTILKKNSGQPSEQPSAGTP